MKTEPNTKKEQITLVFPKETLEKFSEDVNNVYTKLTYLDEYTGTKKDIQAYLSEAFAPIGLFSASILLAIKNAKP